MPFREVIAVSASVWVPWVIVGVLVVGILIAVVIHLRNRPKGLTETKALLRMQEAEAKKHAARVVVEKLQRQKAERDRAAAELALLESKHAEKLKALDVKEKADYEEAKKDPQAGVDYMRKFLGLDS